MAEAAIALGAGQMIGGMISGFGEMQLGLDKQAAAQTEAAYARNAALLTRKSAAEEERRSRILGRQYLGQMRANYGASGVSVAESSALSILEESARNVELDALTVRYAGELQARDYEHQAQTAMTRGGIEARAGQYNMLSSILGGALKGGATFARTG